MIETLPMNDQELQALHRLEQCLQDLIDITKQDLLCDFQIGERHTKAQLLDNLSGYRYQGQRVSASWTKRALIESYREVRIRQHKRDLIAQRDRVAQWLIDMGRGERIEELLHNAEETRLRIVIGPPDPE